jgi:hypothetical protein
MKIISTREDVRGCLPETLYGLRQERHVEKYKHRSKKYARRRRARKNQYGSILENGMPLASPDCCFASGGVL